jgi:hypothetical protein
MGLFDFFRRSSGPELTGDALREQLLQAALSGKTSRLVRLCRKYRAQIEASFDEWRTVPERYRDDPNLLEGYVSGMMAIAQCFEEKLGNPRLVQIALGDEASNPILRWDRQLAEADRLISEARYGEAIGLLSKLPDDMQQCQGRAVLNYVALTRGRLGVCLFHSGKVPDSLREFTAALENCQQLGDREGIAAYLNNLIDVYRYLGKTAATAQTHRVDPGGRAPQSSRPSNGIRDRRAR